MANFAHSLLLAVAANLPASAVLSAYAADYSMVCHGDGEFAAQTTATGGKTRIVTEKQSAHLCETSLTLKDGKISGQQEFGLNDCHALDLQVVINYAKDGHPGEVVALQRLASEAQLWAISFNRKEVVFADLSADDHTSGSMAFMHCR